MMAHGGGIGREQPKEGGESILQAGRLVRGSRERLGLEAGRGGAKMSTRTVIYD